MYSLLIKNGQLFDPDSGLSQRGDIALDGRRIAAVGDVAPCDAAATIDAADCIVTPGLVDMHAAERYTGGGRVLFDRSHDRSGRGQLRLCELSVFPPVHTYLTAPDKSVPERLHRWHLRAPRA